MDKSLILHDSFPKSPPTCKSIASNFFKCLDENTIKQTPKDTEAGIRGIKSCLKEKGLYDTCLDNYIAKKAPKLIRVQEEYRKSNLSSK